jgi:chorismate mutase-like protein
MSSKPPDLAALRQQIDRLDDQIHDALMARASAVSKIAATKRREPGGYIRPGREAQILRRLLARHDGPLPPRALARIWREMISALYVLQGPLQVAIYTPDDHPAYWDLARDHFGSLIQMNWHGSAQAVLQAVTEGSIGILPMPHEADAHPWWPHLVLRGPSAARFIGRLPLVQDGVQDAGCRITAAVLAADIMPEPSGDDVSLIAATAPSDAVSRDRLQKILKGHGLDVRAPLSVNAGDNGRQMALFEIAGFIASDDWRLANIPLGGKDAAIELTWLGAYALPIDGAKP